MNTQSSYVYDDHSGAEGLGRIALPPPTFNRFMPAVRKPIRNNRKGILPIQRKPRVRRVTKSKPVLKPKPIIDRNPVPPPRLEITTIRNAAKKKTRQTKKKAPSRPSKAVQKKTKSIAAQKKSEGKGILNGSISIGNYEIKKTHAAMASGATAGGLLLLKLLL